MKKKALFFILKFFLYILGLFILSFAVVLIMRANFGSGGWDAFNVNLNLLSNGKIIVGSSSMMVGLTFLFIVLIYRKKAKYLFSLVPILFTGSFIDIWDLIILKNFYPESFYIKLILFFLSLFLLPLGLSILIKTDLSPMVYDEFTFILMEIFNNNSFAKVRMGFEAFSIIMAIILGLIYNGKLNEVSFGTFILSFLLGPIISMWLKVLDFITLTFKKNSN